MDPRLIHHDNNNEINSILSPSSSFQHHPPQRPMATRYQAKIRKLAFQIWLAQDGSRVRGATKAIGLFQQADFLIGHNWIPAG
jgi:hypothetical protein